MTGTLARLSPYSHCRNAPRTCGIALLSVAAAADELVSALAFCAGEATALAAIIISAAPRLAVVLPGAWASLRPAFTFVWYLCERLWRFPFCDFCWGSWSLCRSHDLGSFRIAAQNLGIVAFCCRIRGANSPDFSGVFIFSLSPRHRSEKGAVFIPWAAARLV